VILAGGASSRFGGLPKGLATVAGRRIIDRVATALGAVTDSLLLVANDPGADAWLPGVPRISDLEPGRGPLGGIHAALVHARTSVLVVAWDMPFVTAPLLTLLHRRASSGHSAVVPESADGQLEPTCALYAAVCEPAMARWLDSGRAGPAAFLEQLGDVDRVPVAEIERVGEPSRLFFSVNSPAAIEHAEALAASH
jgi:molybdopterin-guanine dinucleotide biosynthesis protein A